MSDVRSPLSSYALTAGELTIGRKIVCFNDRRGVEAGRFRVVGRPDGGLVELESLNSGEVRKHWLADFGVEPYADSGRWNEINFCIDLKDLPGVLA